MPSAGTPKTSVALPPNSAPVAPSVPLAETSKVNPVALVQLLIAPLLGPLGTAALVVLLVIFMLLRREDLRRRLIRLIGNISATTHALDDAGARVFRYLLMQLLVNVSYGIPVAIGLYFIGVECSGAHLLRCSDSSLHRTVDRRCDTDRTLASRLAQRTMPLLTIGLFIVLELLSNNVMEPWLYGSSTVSPQ